MSKLGIGLDIPGRVLEFINGFLFIVCIGMVIFIIWYLLARLAVYKFRFRKFLTTSETRLALAIGLFAFGDAVIRAPVWYMRHLMNHNVDVAPMNDALTFVVTVGALLCSLAGVAVVRLMVSYKMGEWPWLLVVAIAMGFSLIML